MLNSLLGWNGLQQTVVVFDDLGFVDIESEFVSFWQTSECAGEFFFIDGDVGWNDRLSFERLFDDLKWAGLDESDDISDFAEIAWNIDFFAVDCDMAMVDQLTGSGTGARESHTIDKVVQTRFEDAEEGQTGNGGFFLSEDEKTTELTFGNAIKLAKFLFFDELLSVF